ncbi:MAG: hypothetical protein EA409_09335 [Saprospirales bacterium]|nr:MAG: hypothetical protein EA409_09335 [Saprospirales bacterium]
MCSSGKFISKAHLHCIQKALTFVPRFQQRLFKLENHLIKDISRDGSAAADTEHVPNLGIRVLQGSLRK